MNEEQLGIVLAEFVNPEGHAPYRKLSSESYEKLEKLTPYNKALFHNCHGETAVIYENGGKEKILLHIIKNYKNWIAVSYRGPDGKQMIDGIDTACEHKSSEMPVQFITSGSLAGQLRIGTTDKINESLDYEKASETLLPLLEAAGIVRGDITIIPPG